MVDTASLYRPGLKETPEDTKPQTLSCSVGVLAYNERNNIGLLLQDFLKQRCNQSQIKEIIVIASGCTDGTEDVVREAAKKDSRVRLIAEPVRRGKAAAVNTFIAEAKEDLLVLCSADLRLDKDTIERLLIPFHDPEVGMTGARPTPVNLKSTFMGFSVHVLWELHHHIALNHPKLGELVAFRHTFSRIPARSSVDELAISEVIVAQGYRLEYVPKSIVYNQGPDNIHDYMIQRRRIHSGHLWKAKLTGFRSPTISTRVILGSYLKLFVRYPGKIPWLMSSAFLEAAARFMGFYDYRVKKEEHTKWQMAASTKSPTQV